jgi:hypothetical protein
MAKKQILAVALGFLSAVVFAQANSAVDFNIRFFDKKIYYMQGAHDEPIYVQITVANRSAAPFYFKLADNRVFSVDFDVKTTANRPLERTDFLMQKRAASQQVYFRYVSVEAGEAFSFVENLRDYAVLSSAGEFVVQAKLYPDLYKPDAQAQPVSSGFSTPIFSNRLILNVRPRSIIGEDGLPSPLDVETNAVLVREKLAPDQMIEYILTARQKSQWEKFFLYVDLESMVSRDDVRKRKWLAESEEGRRQMVARYRNELQSNIVDRDIVTIPMKFEIKRTDYGAEEGSVTVIEWFKIENYVEKKQYIYRIQRKDDIWMVVNYTVQNLGTE